MIEQRIIQAIQQNDVKLSQKRMNDQHMIFLSQQNTQNIQKLRLKHNLFTPIGINHLLQANWNNLKHLGLWGNRVGTKGCRYLSKGSFESLTYLGLGQCGIETPGLLHLSKAKWRNIEEISLSLNKLAKDTIKIFLKGNWNQIKIIFIGTNIIKKIKITYPQASQIISQFLNTVKQIEFVLNSILLVFKKKRNLRIALEKKMIIYNSIISDIIALQPQLAKRKSLFMAYSSSIIQRQVLYLRTCLFTM